ncbi:hypothetical protein WJX73_009894 [Symbiochloris irregularis]|uniref:Uncharacterized protein n=1 Tax=Symbiochloris irregularis TaxID=706552 RepID=A0AAW1P271_9CHLO
MLVLLFWRAGRTRQMLTSPAGKAAFLHSSADIGQAGDPILTGTSHRSALFAGQSALQSLQDDSLLTGTDRAHLAASAGPTQQQSLGFYWGLAGDSQHKIQSAGRSALAPGLSLEHLQKVAGETGGKAGTGYYFAHDIPEKLKAQPEGASHLSAAPAQTHRKELMPQPKTPHPLGVYFQEQAHKAGLAGEFGHDTQDSPSDKPLKYYFTQDIPDDAKRQLAFKNVMKAKMEAQEASGLGR